MNTGTETLHEPFLKSCKHSGLGRQFGLPHGRAGWLIGHVMAVKNRRVNQAVVDALDVREDDRVLEIGFGPGTALQAIAKRASRGRVAGIDPSEVMLRQAARRNRVAIDSGHVRLEQGSVSSLPFEDGAFTKVVAINSFHHWPQPERDLTEVRRVLRSGGVLLLGLRVKDPTKKFLAPPGFTEDEIGQVEELLRRVGFRDVASEIRENRRERIAAVKAHR